MEVTKLILQACTISFNVLNYIYIFYLFLVSFESCMEYREYQKINHKWYNVNYFVNESIDSFQKEVAKVRRFVPTLINKKSNDRKRLLFLS